LPLEKTIAVRITKETYEALQKLGKKRNKLIRQAIENIVQSEPMIVKEKIKKTEKQLESLMLKWDNMKLELFKELKTIPSVELRRRILEESDVFKACDEKEKEELLSRLMYL